MKKYVLFIAVMTVALLVGLPLYCQHRKEQKQIMAYRDSVDYYMQKIYSLDTLYINRALKYNEILLEKEYADKEKRYFYLSRKASLYGHLGRLYEGFQIAGKAVELLDKDHVEYIEHQFIKQRLMGDSVAMMIYFNQMDSLYHHHEDNPDIVASMAGLYAIRGYKMDGVRILRKYLKTHQDDLIKQNLETIDAFPKSYALLEDNYRTGKIIRLNIKTGANNQSVPDPLIINGDTVETIKFYE